MSPTQLHTRLSQEQVETILESYLAKELSVAQALEKLSIGKSRFFTLIKAYKDPDRSFSIAYKRTSANYAISKEAEQQILTELKKEKKLIENKDISLTTYNYSAVRDDLAKVGITVSVPTIINRAKEHGYYFPRKEKKVHDREVLTNFIGELVQHDSSHHLWSPYMEKKLYLITSLDDYSRTLLYADLWERETTWAHICAVKAVFLSYGCPLKYYADQHAIFRYVKDRDKQSPWNTYAKFTDDVDPQWKQTLTTCKVGAIYALSPQAKGKVERPYRWLQDRIVRRAAKEKLTSIDELRAVLKELIHIYNTKWVHATTKEIPILRFERALEEKRSLFKPFRIPEPYTHLDDIFCLRAQRAVDSYRRISLDGLDLKVPKGMPREDVDLKIVPDIKNNIAHIRFWQGSTCLGSQNVPLEKLKIVRF